MPCIICPNSAVFCVRHWSINDIEYEITAEFLNQRVTSFHYGRYDFRSKPNPRFSQSNLREQGNNNIKQRTSQKFVSDNNFVFLLSNKFTVNNHHFNFILFFLKICDITFAPSITLGHSNIWRWTLSWCPAHKQNASFDSIHGRDAFARSTNQVLVHAIRVFSLSHETQSPVH